jgi:CheY-like chemotaxis protein
VSGDLESMDCKNILVIEDDHAVRQMLKDVLELEGYNVVTAQDGSEGIEHIKKPGKIPCVIILDLMMSGTNGWQFLDFQKSDPSISKIPVIVCSAYHESAKSIKPDALVEKPVKLDQLLGTVHAFCA